jgi:hypothetical protein
MEARHIEESPAMNEILTMEEIERRFDGEWVLIEDPELTEGLKVVRGKVIWHSKDRDEVHGRLLELRPRHAAFFHIGKPPEGMEYVL